MTVRSTTCQRINSDPQRKHQVCRTISTDNEGNLRPGSLPVGVYEVVAEKDGYAAVILGELTVKIGQNTNVDCTLYPDNVETISVIGSAIASIDFTSTESALNISVVERERLRVPLRVAIVSAVCLSVVHRLQKARFVLKI